MCTSYLSYKCFPVESISFLERSNSESCFSSIKTFLLCSGELLMHVRMYMYIPYAENFCTKKFPSVIATTIDLLFITHQNIFVCLIYIGATKNQCNCPICNDFKLAIDTKICQSLQSHQAGTCQEAHVGCQVDLKH